MTEQEILDNEVEIESDELSRELPDHLPTKPGWKVILTGVAYGAFSIFLLAIVVLSVTAQDGVNGGIGWFILFVFGLGGIAAGYSAVDELLHLKDALALDKNGKLENVTIQDNWIDQYTDGGIMTRKDHHHILYPYAEGKEYARHSVTRSVAEALKVKKTIQVQYLPEDPKVYRPVISR